MKTGVNIHDLGFVVAPKNLVTIRAQQEVESVPSHFAGPLDQHGDVNLTGRVNSEFRPVGGAIPLNPSAREKAEVIAYVYGSASHGREVRPAPPQPPENRLEMTALHGVLKHSGKPLRQPLGIVNAEELLQHRLGFLDRRRLPQ